MSYIEDTRKLMQDFHAPELRAISVRLDAQRFSDIDRRFSDVERRAEQRHSETLNAISKLPSYQAVLERLARLESKQNVSAA
jgi:hypothetical protein